MKSRSRWAVCCVSCNVLRYYSPVMEVNVQENRPANIDYSGKDHSIITRSI